MTQASCIAMAIGSLAGLAYAGPALAQADNEPVGIDGQTAESASAPVASDARSPDRWDSGEIVVTAQRREERLSAVPLSVTSLDANQLQRNVIVSTQDLTLIVPGLNWGRSTNFNQPTIRGIGSRNASAGDEPNVASFLDGVYLPDMTGTLFELSNIERIEVLRGPQTTLFGRNATGGAINLITRAPSFTFRAGASASYGDFDYYKLAGYVSGPIAGDVLAVSLSGVRYGDNGYVRNIFTGETQGSSGGTALRGRLLLQATPDLSIQLNGIYSRSNNNVLQSQYALNGNTLARNSIPGGPTALALNPTNIPANQIIADQPFTTATIGEPFGRTRQIIGDIQVSWDLGFATLSGLASLGTTRTPNLSWTDSSPIQLSKTEYTSYNRFRNQELVLTSNANSTFNWLVGLQGFQSDAKFDPLISTGRSAVTGAFNPITTIYGQDTRAYAAFGEATWQLLTDFYLTGGLRYNRDTKRAFNTAGATGITRRNEVAFENFSPRAVVRYEFAQDTSVYASFTQGFKSGTFNSVTSAGLTLPAGPELVDAFEAGAKVRLARGIRFEGALFYYDYTDLQVSTPVVINGVSATTVQNAGQAIIKGAEASLIAQAGPRLQFNAALALLSTEIRNFPNASVQVPRTDLAGVPTNNGNRAAVVNVSGNELIRAPGDTFSVGATYTAPLFGGELIMNGSAFFSGRYFFELTNRLSQSPYEVVNASVTWRAQPEGGLYVSVFGQNLTNEVYAAGFIITSFKDAVQASKPRWFGATVGFDF